MATYELEMTPEQADALARVLGGMPMFGVPAATLIRNQIPVPVPTKIGAVVRAGEQGDVWIRWAYDNHTHSPWIGAGNHEQPYRTGDLGRITEVLFEGVDL